MQTKIGCVKSFAFKCAHKCNFLRINATFVENKCNFLTFLLQQKLPLVIRQLKSYRFISSRVWEEIGILQLGQSRDIVGFAKTTAKSPMKDLNQQLWIIGQGLIVPYSTERYLPLVYETLVEGRLS